MCGGGDEGLAASGLASALACEQVGEMETVSLSLPIGPHLTSVCEAVNCLTH